MRDVKKRIDLSIMSSRGGRGRGAFPSLVGRGGRGGGRGGRTGGRGGNGARGAFVMSLHLKIELS
jgi:hypothetical protein